MYLALAFFPLLVAGGFVGWWPLRGVLDAAWSRPAAITVEDAPYRRGTVSVPRRGPGRRVSLLIGALMGLAFVAGARVALSWMWIVELLDDGHDRAGLVPPSGISLLPQVAIAVQAFLAAATFPRAAAALAGRRVDATDAFHRALASAVLGLVFAVTSTALLFGYTRRPVLYWVAGLLIDETTYALANAAAIVALVIVSRAGSLGPPPDPASRPRRTLTGLDIAGALVSIMIVSGAVFYAAGRH